MVKGCFFFYLTQNIWRKVQAEGLQADYNNNEELALKILHLPALAFVSPFDVRDYFETAIENLPNHGLQGLVLYFERTYIGRTLPGGFHQEPLFPIQMWNQHHEVTQGIPRTSNAVEAWHRLFNATVGCYHPNIWRFIDVFKREQWLVEVKQAKFIARDKPTKHRKTTSMKWGLEV